MTLLFFLSLAIMGYSMKLWALLIPDSTKETRWKFLMSPVLSPLSMGRLQSLSSIPSIVTRGLLLGILFGIHRIVFLSVVDIFEPSEIVMSYMAVPAVLLGTEALVAMASLIWIPAGYVLPTIHRSPWIPLGLGDFWSNRWNRWFSDWVRFAIFTPFRKHHNVAFFCAFAMSGLLHEWVINLWFFGLTGRNLLGSMMIYFLLQWFGILFEKRFLRRRPRSKRLFAYLFVLGPVPLVINESFLRVMMLWPE